MSLTARKEVREQYRDAGNLHARSAIYRFAVHAGPPWPIWVFDQLNLPSTARILEIGCGDGGLWKRNRDRLPAGWKCTLCDLSPGMLAAARKELPRFTFALVDAERLPFANGIFDAVIANHMLYHVADRPRALADIRRVLAPGGRLFASTNSDSHLSRMRDLIERFLPGRIPMSMPFGLENGAQQLAPFFRHVEMRPVGGDLRVTDAEVVVGYVMSVEDAPQLIVGPKLDELKRLVEAEMKSAGAFITTTATGMFIATA